MSKWTPGPWTSWAEIEQGDHSHGITGPSAAASMGCRDGWERSIQAGAMPVVIAAENQQAPALALGDDAEEARANARLIAEAPAMAEELAHLLALIEPALESGVTIPGLATMNRTRALLARLEAE